MTVVDWPLDLDLSIRGQAMRDLTDAPAAEPAAERARIAREGADGPGPAGHARTG